MSVSAAAESMASLPTRLRSKYGVASLPCTQERRQENQNNAQLVLFQVLLEVVCDIHVENVHSSSSSDDFRLS